MLSIARRIIIVKSLILPKRTHPLISFSSPTKEKLKEIEDIFTNTYGILKLSRVILFKAKKIDVFKLFA